MRRDFFVLLFIGLVSVFIAACGGTAPANSGSANAAKENPLGAAKSTAEPTTNNAPTLTPVFKAYCEAWVKNDEAALRKVYSSDTIKDFETQMKADKEKSLIKSLEATDKVSGTPCEVTNEEITGDTAVAKIFSNKYPNGIKVVFVKEKGEWKLTNKSPALDSMKQSPTNSNAAK